MVPEFCSCLLERHVLGGAKVKVISFVRNIILVWITVRLWENKNKYFCSRYLCGKSSKWDTLLLKVREGKSRTLVVGMKRKWNAREKMSAWSGKRGRWQERFSFPLIFLFALSEFRGLDHLGAWNRLLLRVVSLTYFKTQASCQLLCKPLQKWLPLVQIYMQQRFTVMNATSFYLLLCQP